MPRITNEHPTAIDWNPIRQNNPNHNIAFQNIDPINADELPNAPFLTASSGQIDTEGALTHETLVKSLQECLNNRTQVCMGSTNPGLFNREIRNLAHEIAALTQDGLPHGAEWTHLTSSNGETLWLHIDIKKGTIGFYHPAFSSENAYIHTRSDANGDVFPEIHSPIYRSFKAQLPKRLKDKDFFDKLLSLNSLESSSEMIEALTQFLKLKEQQLPPPKKAPLFYQTKQDQHLIAENDPLKFIGLALSLRGNISPKELKQYLDRLTFLKKFDHYIEELKSIDINELQELQKKHLEDEKNSPNEDFTAAYEKFKKLEILSKQILYQGQLLEKDKALKSDERAALLTAVKRLATYKEQLNALAINGSNFAEVEELPGPVMQEDAHILDAYDDLEVIETRQNNLQDRPAAPREAIEQNFEINALEIENDFKIQLENCQNLLSAPETLKQGLNELNQWIAAKKQRHASMEDILAGIIKALPIMERTAFHKANTINTEYHNCEIEALVTYLKSIEQYLISPLAAPNLDNENLKNLFWTASTLVGYLSYGLVSPALNLPKNPYPLNYYISKLQKGIFLKDPSAQRKAAKIVNFVLTENESKKHSILSGLADIKPVKENEQSSSDANPREHFKQLLLKQIGERLLKKPNILNAFKLKWQRADLGGTWAFAIEHIKSKLLKDLYSFQELSKAKHTLHEKVKKSCKSIVEQLDTSRSYCIAKEATLLSEIYELFKNSSDEATKIDQLKQALKKHPEFKSHYLFATVNEFITDLESKLKTDGEFEAHANNLKATPMYRDIDFSDLEKAISERGESYYPTYSKLENTLFDQLTIANRSRRFNITGKHTPSALLDLNHFEKTSSEFEAISKRIGIDVILPKTYKEPTHEEITEFYLYTENFENKEALLEGSLLPLSVAFGSTMSLYTNLEVSDSPITDGCTEEKLFEDLTPHGAEKERSLATHIKDCLSGERYRWTAQKKLASFKSSFQFGYGAHADSNKLASPHVASYNYDENKYSEELSVVKKELAEATTERRDEVWKAINFIANHPASLKETEIFETLLVYLFDFHHIDHIRSAEINGVHHLVSQEIPKKLQFAINALHSRTLNPSVSEEDKKFAVQALGNLLLIAIDLKDYLEKSNALEKNDQKKINLEHYGNYRLIAYQHLGVGLSDELTSLSDSGSFAKQYLNRFNLEQISSANKEETEAISYFLAGAEFASYEHPSPTVKECLNKIKLSPDFSKNVLHHYFAVHGHVEVPEGIIYDWVQKRLYFDGKQAELPFCNLISFDAAVLELGIQPPKGNWYLEDKKLVDNIAKLLGKPIGHFNITRSYEIEGTPYSFNEQGEIFYTLKDGTRIKYQEAIENPFDDFKLGYQFNEEQDHCFIDAAHLRVWVIRNGETNYWRDHARLVRLKDKAVCLLSDDKPIWRIKGENNSLIAYSIQHETPPGEYKFTEVNGKIREESLRHPGYFITNQKPYCHHIDLSQCVDNHILLENENGEQILICQLSTGDSKEWVEFSLFQNAIRTKNPWHLVLLLLKSNNHSLISTQTSHLYLDPPKTSFDIAVGKELAEQVENLQSGEMFSAWLHWFKLDKAARGNEGGLRKITVGGIPQLIQSYITYRNHVQLFPELRASKEIERVFLSECQMWFNAEETRLIQELSKLKLNHKNEKKAKKKAGRARMIVTTGENPNKKPEKKSFYKKCLARITGKNPDIEKINKELLTLRVSYRNIFISGVEGRFKQLQTGKSTPNQSSWKKNAKLDEDLNSDEDFINAAESPEILSSVQECLNKLSLNKPADVDTALSSFKSWSDLNALYQQNESKEEFIKQHLLDFYHLSQKLSRKSNDRIQMMKWLELTPKNAITCRWMIAIANSPKRYIDIKNFLTSELAHNQKLNAIIEIRDRTQKEYSDAKAAYAKSLESTRNRDYTDPNINAIIQAEQEERSRLWRIKYDSKTALKKHDEDIEKLKQEGSKAKEKALERKHTWKIIFKLVKIIFNLLKARFRLRRFKRPLRLSETRLSRPYETIKRSIANCGAPALQTIDRSFDEYFDSWRSKLIDEQAAESSNVRNLIGNDPCIEKAKIELEEFRSLELPPVFILKDQAELNEFSDSLKQELSNCSSELKTRQAALLMQANQTNNASKELERLQQVKQIEWKDLIKYAHKAETYAYNKHLADSTKIKPIQQGVYQYLGLQTRFFQLQRTAATLQQMLSNPNGPSAASVQRLGEHLSEKRAYDGSNAQDTSLLFFEAASPNGLFSKQQVLKIKELGTHPIEIAPMPTGFGKTERVLPTKNDEIQRQSKIKAEASLKKPHRSWIKKIFGSWSRKPHKATLEQKIVVKKGTVQTKKLVLNLWPNAISDLNFETTRSKTELATTAKIQQFKFSRDVSLDSSQLEHFYQRVERAKQKGEAISVRSSDVSSIYLHWIEKLEEHHNGNKSAETLRCLEFYGKILTVLFTSSTITIDEAREVLDPKQRTIYTLGNSQKVPDYAIDFASEIFNNLMKNETFSSLIKENATLTPDDLDIRMKELLNEETLSIFANAVGFDHVDLGEFREFLSGGIKPKSDWTVDSKKLYLAKGYYTIIIKAALTGAAFTRFGLSKLHYDTCKFAIPFEKQDSPKETPEAPMPSTYQNIDEISFITKRVYRTRGLTRENLLDLVEKLLEDYDDEDSKYKERDINERPSYKQLLKAFNKMGIEQRRIGKLIEASKEARKTKILGLIEDHVVERSTKNDNIISLFIKKCVAPGIKVYPKSIGITPQDILDLFEESISVTATPQEAKVHSLRTTFIKMSGAMGKMFDALLSKIHSIRQIPENDLDESLFIRELSEGCKTRNVRAVSDPSGLKKFDLNFVKKLAAELNTQQTDIHYIVYFDTTKGELVRYNINTHTFYPFDFKSHEPKNTLTIYDQARSTGTDIVQSPDAVMVMLLADSSTATQAGQGGGRMRQLHRGQSIEAWLNKPINSKDSESYDKLLVELIEKLIQNDLQTSLSTNLSAFEQSMASELKGAMTRKMLGINRADKTNHLLSQPSKMVEIMVEHYKKFRPEYVTETPYDPELAYGGITQPVSADKALYTTQKTLEDKAKKYFSGKEAQAIIGKLQAYRPEWRKIPLPENNYGVSAGATQEVSAMQEVSTSTSVNADVELQNALISSNHDHKWKTKDEWPKTPDHLHSLSFTAVNAFEGKKELQQIKNELQDLYKANQTINDRSYSLNASDFKKEQRLKKKKNQLEDKISNNLNHNVNRSETVEFIKAKDAITFQLQEPFTDGIDFLEEELLLSSNFTEQLMDNPSALLNSSHKKFLNHLLLIADGQGAGRTSYKAVAIDDFDAKQLHDLFELERENEENIGRRKMAIYSIDMNAIVDQGKNQFTDDELKCPAIIAFSAQAKMIAGKTRFTKKEKEYLIAKLNIINEKQAQSKKTAVEQEIENIGQFIFANLLKQFNSDPQAEAGRFKHLLEV